MVKRSTPAPANCGGAEETRTPDLTPVGERECGCPPWALRCAHWDGVVLVLGDLIGFSAEGDPRYEVGGPCKAADISRAFGYVCGCWRTQFPHPEGFVTSDLAAAEDEFARRELELLGRESGGAA